MAKREKPTINLTIYRRYWLVVHELLAEYEDAYEADGHGLFMTLRLTPEHAKMVAQKLPAGAFFVDESSEDEPDTESPRLTRSSDKEAKSSELRYS